MKFYIASGLKNYARVRALAQLLKNAGWEHMYDWTAHCPAVEMNPEALRSIGEAEFEGIKQSDVVIFLSPQGRGTHVELGMALALKKSVYLCNQDDALFHCDGNTVAFYWMRQVKWLVGNVEEIAAALLCAMSAF